MRLLTLLALLPVYAILFFIYTSDRNPEPRKILGKLLIGGAVVSVILTFVFTSIIDGMLGDFVDTLEAAHNGVLLFVNYTVRVGFIEEFSKWLVVIFVAYKSKEFDELYDGIVYSIFVSLGFAALENILYVVQYGYSTALLRAFLSVPGHAAFGFIMGFFVGLARKSHNKGYAIYLIFLLLSLAVPSVIHGAFDAFLSSNRQIDLTFFYALVIITNIIMVTGVLKISAKNEKIAEGPSEKVANINRCPACGGPDINTRYCIQCGSHLRG